MTLQVEILDLRKMLKEKCEEIINDEKLAYEFYRIICEIEEDDRFKKQEIKKPYSIITSAAGVSFASCPCCGEHIDENRNPKFCGNCGQAVKWE